MRNRTEYKGLRILLISVVLCGIFHIVEAGVNYRFDETRCSNDNSIKLGQVLIDCYGADTIRSWLKKGFGMVMICELDSNGCVSKISNKILSKFYYKKNRNVDMVLIDTLRLLRLLKRNNVQFSICVDSEILNWIDSVEVMAIELENNPCRKLNIAFPGQLSRMFWNVELHEFMADSLLNYIIGMKKL